MPRNGRRSAFGLRRDCVAASYSKTWTSSSPLARVSASSGEPPRPERWGGYRLAPEAYEFWQHRDDRLHDRFRYERAGGGWRIERLQP